MKIFKLISEQQLSHINLIRKNIFIVNENLSTEAFLNLVPFHLKDNILYIEGIDFSEDNSYNKLYQLIENDIKNIYKQKNNSKDFNIEVFREDNYLNYISQANKSIEYYKALDLLNSNLSKGELSLLIKEILNNDYSYSLFL